MLPGGSHRFTVGRSVRASCPYAGHNPAAMADDVGMDLLRNDQAMTVPASQSAHVNIYRFARQCPGHPAPEALRSPCTRGPMSSVAVG